MLNVLMSMLDVSICIVFSSEKLAHERSQQSRPSTEKDWETTQKDCTFVLGDADVHGDGDGDVLVWNR